MKNGIKQPNNPHRLTNRIPKIGPSIDPVLRLIRRIHGDAVDCPSRQEDGKGITELSPNPS